MMELFFEIQNRKSRRGSRSGSESMAETTAEQKVLVYSTANSNDRVGASIANLLASDEEKEEEEVEPEEYSGYSHFLSPQLCMLSNG